MKGVLRAVAVVGAVVGSVLASGCATLVRGGRGVSVEDYGETPDGTAVAVYTDGLLHRGSVHVTPQSLLDLIVGLLPRERGAQELADALLDDALRSQGDRPVDDASVLVASVLRRPATEGRRRLLLRLPV